MTDNIKKDQLTEQEMHEKILDFLNNMEGLKEYDEYLIQMHASFHAFSQGCLRKKEAQNNYFYFTQFRELIKLAKLLQNNGVPTE